MSFRALLLLGTLLLGGDAALAQAPSVNDGSTGTFPKHLTSHSGLFELAVSGPNFNYQRLTPVSAAILPDSTSHFIDTGSSTQMGAPLGVHIDKDQGRHAKLLFRLRHGMLVAVGVWQPWIEDGGRWLSLDSGDTGTMVRPDWSQSVHTGLAPLRLLNKRHISENIMAISHPLVSSIDSSGKFAYDRDSSRWVACMEKDFGSLATPYREYFIAYLVEPGRIPEHCTPVTLTPVAPPTLRTTFGRADRINRPRPLSNSFERSSGRRLPPRIRPPGPPLGSTSISAPEPPQKISVDDNARDVSQHVGPEVIMNHNGLASTSDETEMEALLAEQIEMESLTQDDAPVSDPQTLSPSAPELSPTPVSAPAPNGEPEAPDSPKLVIDESSHESDAEAKSTETGTRGSEDVDKESAVPMKIVFTAPPLRTSALLQPDK